MNQNQHYDNLCAAAAHFGMAAQVEKTVEEARELVTELLYWRETGTCWRTYRTRRAWTRKAACRTCGIWLATRHF